MGVYFLYNKHNVFHRSRVFSNFSFTKTIQLYRFYNVFRGSRGRPAAIQRPSGGPPAEPFREAENWKNYRFYKGFRFVAPPMFYIFSVIFYKGEHNYIEKRRADWPSAFIWNMSCCVFCVPDVLHIFSDFHKGERKYIEKRRADLPLAFI